MDGISLYDDCVMLAYNKEVRRNCLPFTCGENDLDDFFLNDADLYADELLGKTYCWVTTEIPHHIVALFTLSNDSIKTRLISPNDKNRLQRNIVNPKRGRSYSGRTDRKTGGQPGISGYIKPRRTATDGFHKRLVPS